MCLHPGVFRDNSECPIMDYCSDMDKIVSEVFSSPGDALLFRLAHFFALPWILRIKVWIQILPTACNCGCCALVCCTLLH